MGPPEIDDPGTFAFRMYRNYDGLGSAFGETSVRANSADQGQLAIYAARRGGDGALTLMVINKTGQALTSTVVLTGFVPAPRTWVYRYSASDLDAIADCLLRLSQLVTDHPDIRELDINPLIVYPRGEGAVVADARIILSET